MLFHLSVILSTGGGCLADPPGQTPPRQTPPPGQTLPSRHPLLGRHSPCRHPQADTPRQTPPGQTPAPWADTPVDFLTVYVVFFGEIQFCAVADPRIAVPGSTV